MDLLSMLQNAIVVNPKGYVLGEVTGVSIAEGKLTLTMETDEDNGEEDGEEEDEDPLKPAGPLKFGKIRKYEKDKDDG